MAVDQQQAPQDRAPQPSRGDSQPQPDYPAPYGQPQPYAPAPYPGQPYPQQPLPQQPMPQEPPRHHVHHSYIWLGSIQAGAAMFFVVLVSGFSGFVGALADGETIGDDLPLLMLVIGAIVLGLVLIIGLVALFQWLSYKHLYYIIGPEEFNLYSGIFNKKRVHVPYQRIQSVDQRASLLQRVFGVCTVSIDTAGGSNNKAVSGALRAEVEGGTAAHRTVRAQAVRTAVQKGMAPVQAAVAVAAASGVMLPQVARAPAEQEPLPTDRPRRPHHTRRSPDPPPPAAPQRAGRPGRNLARRARRVRWRSHRHRHRSPTSTASPTRSSCSPAYQTTPPSCSSSLGVLGGARSSPAR